MDTFLPVVYEDPFVPPPKWEIAAKILAYNGWKKGKTKNGAVGLAAATVGVHYQTIIYWTKSKDFINLVEQQEARLVATATEGLAQMLDKNVSACLGVLQNLRPNKWDPRIRLEKLKATLQAEITKELMTLAPDLPIPTYIDTAQTEDPDEGQRPKGYDDFRPIPETP